MKRKLMIISLLSFVVLVSTLLFGYLSGKALTTSTRAANGEFSSENSLVFTEPLKAKAGGVEKLRITVFLLNNKGLGVTARKVSFSPTENITLENIQNITDSAGQAVFGASSVKAGDYYIEVLINGSKSGLKAHLIFD